MTDTYYIYGKSSCSNCVKAKQLSEKYKLNYLYMELGKDWDVEQFKKIYNLNPQSVPQIILNGNVIGGYESFKKHLGDF